MSRARRTLTALLAAALAVVVLPGDPVDAARAEPGPGAEGIGDAYYPKDGNGGYDVKHYDIAVDYDFLTARLTGDTTIRLTAKRSLTSFNLDLLLDVDGVTVDGAAADFTKTSGHELQVTHPLDQGETAEVRVTYHGAPALKGYNGEFNWLADSREVVTMNEPHMAPWWFPANDHPRDKATFTIAVTVPAGNKVISNGERAGAPVVDGDSVTTTWRMRQPMTTYLAYFAAGDFAVDRGATGDLPWTIAVSKQISLASRTRMLKLLRKSGPITRWLQSELGRYPFASTGGLVTSLNAGFALENQTRPTYSGGVSTLLIVHELAHQWFGDSVAVHRWRDIWLNEGFATYMEVRWREAHGGPSTSDWLVRAYDGYRDAQGFWQRDISDPGSDVNSELFAWPVYQRGAMALAALRNKIGRRVFDGLLKRWATVHRHDTARVPGFIRLAERRSGRQLDRFFEVWLREPTAPRRTVRNGFPRS